MRLTTIFLLAFCLTASAGSYAQKVTLSVRNAKLEKVFKEIKKQTGYVFFYDTRVIEDAKRVTLTVRDESVEEALRETLHGQPLDFSIARRTITIFEKTENSLNALRAIMVSPPREVVPEITYATITGTVKDAQGNPLAGVSVIVKGTKRGTSTAADGSFSIEANKGDKLEISIVGYKLKNIIVGNESSVNIVLEKEIKALDEIVAIGYGTQKKRDLTGAIGSINSSDIQNTPIKDVMSALQGRVSGVQVVSNSGAPGDGIMITVRGQSSLNSGNSPLYIIDGVPIESTPLSNLNGYESHSLNPLADINPEDIESIEVLKDAASTSIYGSRAANGIILITTKHGRAGKAKINLNLYTGLSKITRHLGVLNASQWRSIIIDSYYNLDAYNNATVTSEPHWTAIDSLNPMNSGDVDWQSVMYRTAPQTQLNLSILGGTNVAKYAFNTSVLDQDGIFLGSNYKRITSRLNTDFDVNRKVKIGFNLSFSHGRNNRINAAGTGNNSLVQSILVRPPTYSLTYPDGSPIYYFNGKRNPVGLAEEATHLNTTNRITGNQYLEYQILNDLKFRTNLSIDFLSMKEDEFYPTTVDYREGYNLGAVRSTSNLTWINENYLSYDKVFGDNHRISLLAGFSQQAWKTETTGLDGMYFASDNVRTLNGAGTISNQAVNVTTEHGLVSYFGRVGYSYMGKYIFQANIRSDGSSRFGKDKKFGYFPSASAAWRFSDEPFLKAINFLNDGKLRFSIGQTGNEAIGNYTSQGEFAIGTNYLTNSGASPTIMPNAGLTWETATEYNLGIDLSMLNNRAILNGDVYIKNTSNLLFGVPIPETTGFGTITQNIGKIKNKGLEISLTTYNLMGKFRWNSSFNIGFNRNKITSLPEEVLTDGFIQNGLYQILKVGESIGTFYGYKFLGVYSRDEDNKNQVRNGSSNGKLFRGGDPIWDDINGDHIIDAKDRQIIGNAQPNFTGGLTNNFSYLNFTLDVFFQFSNGNDIYSNLNMMRNWVFAYNNVSTDALQRWRKQGDVTNYPRPIRNDPLGNELNRVSSRWVEDGSYLKLKNIRFSYDLPSNIIQRLKLTNVKVYFSCENLITWTHYTAYDPDVSSYSNLQIGIDDGSYPQSRTFIFGLNLAF